MKFRLREIRTMQAGLDAILVMDIPVKPAYWLARFLDRVRSAIGATEKTRVKLAEKYVKKDKNGKLMLKKDNKGKQIEPAEYDFTKENLIKFGKEYTELSEQEFDIDFKPIKLADLGNIKLKPIVFIQLGKLIEE